MQNDEHKIDSVATYVVIYVLLMALLVGTVVAANVDLGRWNTVVSLVIAAIKAILVILFFMHVRHSSKLTWIFAAAAFVWLGLLLALTMTDYASRNMAGNPVARSNGGDYFQGVPGSPLAAHTDR
jgi:cytochrome c oxidase subunit 4